MLHRIPIKNKITPLPDAAPLSRAVVQNYSVEKRPLSGSQTATVATLFLVANSISLGCNLVLTFLPYKS